MIRFFLHFPRLENSGKKQHHDVGRGVLANSFLSCLSDESLLGCGGIGRYAQVSVGCGCSLAQGFHEAE
jgi:hypothetical protein